MCVCARNACVRRVIVRALDGNILLHHSFGGGGFGFRFGFCGGGGIIGCNADGGGEPGHAPVLGWGGCLCVCVCGRASEIECMCISARGRLSVGG